MDELVRQYLVKKGYTQAADELARILEPEQGSAAGTKRSLNATGRYMTARGDAAADLQQQHQQQLTSEDLVVWGLHGGDAALYHQSYSRFRSWAYGSLDLIKNELISLCFPLFTTSYIGLIKRGEATAAKTFWKAFAQDHKDWWPHELQALSMLVEPSQLAEKEFFSSFPFVYYAAAHKFTVRLSTMVINLLTTFLSQNDLLLIAAMVNEKISIERSSQLLPSEEAMHAELQGYSSSSPSSSSASRAALVPIFVHVPGMGNLPSHMQQSEAVSFRDFRTDELYQKWLKTVLLRRIFAGGEDKDEDKHHKPEEPADPLEPSIIFATFTNVNDSMICLDMDKDAHQAAAGFRDGCVRVWQPSASEGIKTQQQEVAWEYNKIYPWKDAAALSHHQHNTQQQQQQQPPPPPSAHQGQKSPHQTQIELRGHNRPVYGIAQNSNRRLVLSSSADETIRLWDVNKRQCVAKYSCLMPSWGVSFSPVDYYFASANMDRTLTLFSTDRLEPIRIMTGHSSDVTCCTWHHNASMIASGSDDKTARLWDARTGSSVRVFTGSHSALSCIAVSPAGTHIAAGSDSGTILLWDVATGAQLAMLRGHEGPVHSISFSNRDGACIASGGADCSIKLWDLTACTSPSSPAVTDGGAEALFKLQPVKSFFTKMSPVFHVNFSDNNLVSAGGPFRV